MLLDIKRGYLFVHVYKTGGTSVARTLRASSLKPLPRIIAEPLSAQLDTPFAHFVRGYTPHASVTELREMLGSEVYNSLFSFAFVRNPWDWQVSLYHYISQHRGRGVRFHRNLVSPLDDFSDYLDWRIREAFHTQSEYLVDRRRDEVDISFVGRFETFDADFQQVCNRIGIRAPLQHRNASVHKGYRELYNDRSRDLVAKAFSEDIERFGYEF